MTLPDGRAVLVNYAKKKKPGLVCLPGSEERRGIDAVMHRLGLLPGLHVFNLQRALRREAFIHSRIAAGPKYIILHKGKTPAKPWVQTHWGAYVLTRGVFPSTSALHLYLPEEFIDENE